MGWWSGEDVITIHTDVTFTSMHNEDADKYNRKDVINIYALPVYAAIQNDQDSPPFLISAYLKSLGHTHKRYKRYMYEHYFRPQPKIFSQGSRKLDENLILARCVTDAQTKLHDPHITIADITSHDALIIPFMRQDSSGLSVRHSLMLSAYMLDKPNVMYSRGLHDFSGSPVGQYYIHDTTTSNPTTDPVYTNRYYSNINPYHNDWYYYRMDAYGVNGVTGFTQSKMIITTSSELEFLGISYTIDRGGLEYTGYIFIPYTEGFTGFLADPTDEVIIDFGKSIPPMALREDGVWIDAMGTEAVKTTKKALKIIQCNYNELLSGVKKSVAGTSQPNAIKDIYVGFFADTTDKNTHVLHYVYEMMHFMFDRLPTSNYEEVVKQRAYVGSVAIWKYIRVRRWLFEYETGRINLAYLFDAVYTGTYSTVDRPTVKEYEFIKLTTTSSGIPVHIQSEWAEYGTLCNWFNDNATKVGQDVGTPLAHVRDDIYVVIKNNFDGTSTFIAYSNFKIHQRVPIGAVGGATYVTTALAGVTKGEHLLPILTDVLEAIDYSTTELNTVLHRSFCIYIASVQYVTTHHGGFAQTLIKIVGIVLLVVAIASGVGAIAGAFATSTIAGLLAVVKAYGVSVLLDKLYDYVDEHVDGFLGTILKLGISYVAGKVIPSDLGKIGKGIDAFTSLTNPTVPQVMLNAPDVIDESPEDKAARVKKQQNEAHRNKLLNPSSLPMLGVPATFWETPDAYYGRVMSLDVSFLLETDILPVSDDYL